jgi:hypothetical protein
MQDTGFGVSPNWCHFSSFLGGWFSYTASLGVQFVALSYRTFIFAQDLLEFVGLGARCCSVCCCSVEGNK